METQKNRGKDQDLKKDSLSHSKQQDNSQKKTPEASTKKSEQLREDRSQIDKDSARKPVADKQPRK